MTTKVLGIVNNSIALIYLAIALITPLIFTTQTTELYEVPKMFFVYVGTSAIFFLTIIKFLLQKQFQVPKNPVILSFVIFILIQLISTFFSIDKFTSIFGFPTRLNGSLVSQFAYFVLLFSALVNISKTYAQKLLIVLSTAALAVALLGIPGHFDKDPSCLILTGKITSSCWQVGFEPTQRIFSTLGQPNWLASYLVLTIPLTFSFALTFQKKLLIIFFLTSSIIQFWALIFTASRAGILGILTASFVFLILLGKYNLLKFKKVLTVCALTFLSLYLIFGTNLTSRTLEPLTSIQQKEQNQSQNQELSSQPASLPTESAQIRLIVWYGAIDIFKHSPVLGTGPETFAFSYFMFRPAEHNQTTEWDFFYNKAHNEFLNYLATTGVLGFISYIAFLLITFHQLLKDPKKDSPLLDARILNTAAAASVAGYLVTIFFGFSTVATQTTFFLMIAAILIFDKKNPLKIIDLKILKEKYQFPAILFISIIGFFFFSLIIRIILSDIFIKTAQDYKDISPSKSITAYNNAVTVFPVDNSNLLADYANSLAHFSESSERQIDTQTLTQKADEFAKRANALSPNNFLIIQKLTKTYILLASLDSKYQSEALSLGENLTRLAPTYPISFLTLAKVQVVSDQEQEAIKSLKIALELKPDYLEAQELYEQLTLR